MTLAAELSTPPQYVLDVNTFLFPTKQCYASPRELEVFGKMPKYDSGHLIFAFLHSVTTLLS